MNMKTKKKTVSEAAIVSRIKRKLAHEGKTISFGHDPWCGSERVWRLVDGNTITAQVDDLAAYANELGVMHEYETIAVMAATPLGAPSAPDSKPPEDRAPHLGGRGGAEEPRRDSGLPSRSPWRS
jgi:hypothetical protein